ncbi:hypothetical protein BWQ96_06660 [Gracilariopsis chorda]|uniref:Uncharacterized protein n=1 Tax=Gracilariopsis chorda TaxID=448386 RepID=A0A2V3IN94_9FLOR|nr:hypothetical protein BWQ96_06660 [Gracilariopsis chorda]|eukprot:PXF43548.1 hypothetical protein BWQ96_06660 [Gracilariopsis chorda]
MPNPPSTPDRKAIPRSARSAFAANTFVSFSPRGVPKSSSITCSPSALRDEDGDFGFLLDMTVDSGPFEMDDSTRSIRFTLASSQVSHLFPQSPRSQSLQLPTSLKSVDGSEENDLSVKVSQERVSNYWQSETHESTSDQSGTPMDGVTGLLPASIEAKTLSPETLTVVKRDLEAFSIEPVTPPGTRGNNSDEREHWRPFPTPPKSLKLFEKFSIRREKRDRSPSTMEYDEQELVNGGAQSPDSPTPLRRLTSGLDRLFSRVSNISRTDERNNGDGPRSSAAPEVPTPPRKTKTTFARWRKDIRKLLQRLVD